MSELSAGIRFQHFQRSTGILKFLAARTNGRLPDNATCFITKSQKSGQPCLQLAPPSTSCLQTACALPFDSERCFAAISATWAGAAADADFPDEWQ